MRTQIPRPLFASLASLLLPAALAGEPPAAEQWGCCELAFPGPASANPYLDTTLAATFRQGERQVTVPGFWKEADTFAVRFSAPSPGEWHYQTCSNRPELDGRTGVLAVAPPTAGNHGPVQVRDTRHFAYADGTPYHPFGTTCYAWIHQPRALWEQTLRTLAGAPFNKLRFCVFPKSYTYNANEPELFPFVRRADGSFDCDRPDPAFWRHLEARILDLQHLGIEADLIHRHPYDRCGFADMNPAPDARYLRYVIARLSAHRHLWCTLANDYDLMAPGAMRGHRGNKTLADWDRFFGILQQEDPHQRLRSIHNCRGFYDHTRSWVTHASLQTSDLAKGVLFRRQFGKPVVYDECCYEGNVPEGWGNLTPQQMTQRFWLGTLGGCYVGHGETYKHPEDILWWSKGGALHGESPRRIQWLRELLAAAPPFAELEPMGDDRGRYVLAKPGAYYLAYCTHPGAVALELAGDRPYKVDAVDPWAMAITPVGSAQPGPFAVQAPKADLAYRLTPYAPGEALRPEAALVATPVSGLAPLTVRFHGSGGAPVRWDFGDGSTSSDPDPMHTFAVPGIYPVALTVRDEAGATAQAALQVVVDHDARTPLVRIGVAEGEVPSLRLHGSAVRTAEGGLRLPLEPPWGWVEAGNGPATDLAGLRSFALLGWLRPESLQTGSGGNRILFCLNRDRDGIDLVYHADGRLRLAVNQWPDSVDNDSSPARLVVGKWTFFAVAYDGTRTADNVAWFFSAPLAAPDPATVVRPDRITAHAAGPVGLDVGPLAIGNFNPTLQSAGLDRQFRGEIRGLLVFGSRLDGRGALSTDAVRKGAALP